MTFEPAALALALWAWALTSVQIVAAHRARRAIPSPWETAGSHDTTLVLRPCAGVEPGLEENLASTALAAWRGPLRVRFGVARADDPAATIAERAAEALRRNGIDAACVVTDRGAENPKAAQLAAMMAREEPFDGVVLVADSDVDLTALPLGDVSARLERDKTLAALWVPPVEREGETLGDRASRAVLGSSLHAFTLLAHLDPEGVVGKLLALRADALRAVGGFDALSAHLGEDIELARRLREKGLRVEAAPFVAPSNAAGRGVREVIERYARWIAVIRAQRPRLLWTYPTLLFGASSWTLCAAGVFAHRSGAHPALAPFALAVWLSRVLVARVASRRAGIAHTLRDIARAELTLASSFVLALRSRRVAWRGRTLTLRRDGSLEAA